MSRTIADRSDDHADRAGGQSPSPARSALLGPWAAGVTGQNPAPVAASASGKLVLCGEYAVLEPGGTAVCTAVDLSIQAVAASSQTLDVALEVLDGRPGPVTWDGRRLEPRVQMSSGDCARARFALAAAAQVLAAFVPGSCSPAPFSLFVSRQRLPFLISSLETKPGFGASAAVVAAVSAALSAWHGRLSLPPGGPEGAEWVELSREDKDRLFALAFDAHRRAQDGRGSGVDVAASVHGGTVFMETGEGVPRVTPLTWPSGLQVVVCWTGRSVDTRDRVARYWEARRADPDWFSRFVESSRAATARVRAGLEAGDVPSVLQALETHRALIQALGRRLELPMETPEMARFQTVASRFGVFKPSGAGGGDCALLFLERASLRAEADAALRAHGLVPLPVALHGPGVRLVR